MEHERTSTRIARSSAAFLLAAVPAILSAQAINDVFDEVGNETTYEITGEDEADATRHRIAPHSPLARALLGAQVGDVVTWKRPAGAVELEVVWITHADP